MRRAGKRRPRWQLGCVWRLYALRRPWNVYRWVDGSREWRLGPITLTRWNLR